MKQRIWELDAFRGLCVLGMVIVHFIFDLVELYGLVQWEYPPIFSFIKDWGGVLFVLVSGTCATLGSRSVKRGAIVFSCGMLVTAVTFGLYWLGLANSAIIIYFGALHCLGVCMLLWPLFRKLPAAWLAVVGGVLTALGLWLRTRCWDFPWLIPLGFQTPDFLSADYFPLLPNMGFFLLGAALGRVLYAKKESLLPNVNTSRAPIPFLTACGRNSLLIYLLHQPIITGITMMLAMLRR